MSTTSEKLPETIGSSLLYLSALAVLLSPQFSLFGSIGPGGLLRADQILIPALLLLLAIVNLERFRLLVSHLSLSLLLMTAAISISLLLNISLFGLDLAAGDVFDILIWYVYGLAFMIIGGNVSLDVAERCFKLILLTTVLISLFAITQALEFQFAVTTLGELYTARSPRIVGLSPTGTTSNPNTLGKLVLLPLFAFFGLFYRSLVGAGAVNILRTILWGGSALLSGLIIILSDSRSALVGAVLGLGIIVCMLILAKIGSPKRRKLVIGGTAITVFSALILSIFVLEIGRIGELQHPLQDSSLRQRFTKWEAILPIVLERPLIGHGPSNRFIQQVPSRYIDSGVFSWLYHYGILGILSYLYLVLSAVRLGVSGLSDESLFQERPVLWSASVAVLGWFSGTLAVWTVAGVPQSRRVFALVVFVVALVATHLYRSKSRLQ